MGRKKLCPKKLGELLPPSSPIPSSWLLLLLHAGILLVQLLGGPAFQLSSARGIHSLLADDIRNSKGDGYFTRGTPPVAMSETAQP